MKKLKSSFSKRRQHTLVVAIPKALKDNPTLFFELFHDSEKLIATLNTLMWLVYKNGGVVKIAQETIAEMINSTRETVNRYIGFLSSIGFVKKYCINDIYDTLEYELDEMFYLDEIKSWAWKYVPNVLKLFLVCSPRYVLPDGQITPICSNVTMYKGETLMRRAEFNKITSTLLGFSSSVKLSIQDAYAKGDRTWISTG